MLNILQLPTTSRVAKFFNCIETSVTYLFYICSVRLGDPDIIAIGSVFIEVELLLIEGDRLHRSDLHPCLQVDDDLQQNLSPFSVCTSLELQGLHLQSVHTSYAHQASA